MKNRRFALAKAPYIRRADSTLSTSQIMNYFVIALVPIILFAWIKNGFLPFLDVETKTFSSVLNMLYPLILVFIGGFTSFISEFVYFKFIKKTITPIEETKNSFAIIPGLLLGMIVSINTPLWILILGTLFATVIGKLLFGGFGKNVFNPALVGYLFIQTAYFGVVAKNGGYLNGSEAISLDIVSGVTPLANLAANPTGHFEQLVAPYGSLMDFFIGTIPGSLAETSALLCILAAGFLIWKKVINWRIPVIYVGTVFALTYIIGAFNGHAAHLWYPTFGILSGGLMFGAVFMATEPVTSPRTPNGKVLYALSLGALTILFRYKSNFPEGVATSILAMNLLVIIYDNIASRLRVNPKTKQVIATYAVFGLVLIGISAYAISSVKPATLNYSYDSSEVDYETLNINHKVKYGNHQLIVQTDLEGNVTKVDLQGQTYLKVDEIDHSKLESNYKNVGNYIDKAYLNDDDNYVLIIKTKGFKSELIETNVVFDKEYNIISFKSDISNETYNSYNSTNDPETGWVEANGHPDKIIEEIILEGETNSGNINPISGATVTSDAIKKAMKLTFGYIEALKIEKAFIGKSPAIKVDYIKNSFDVPTMNFKYEFKIGDEEFYVLTNTNYEIQSFSNTEFDTELIRPEVETVISSKKVRNYIVSVTGEGSNLIFQIKTQGYATSLISTVIVNKETKKIISLEVNDSDETYDADYNQGWNSANGHPSDKIPPQIVEHQGDLSQVVAVSGATVTSNAIKRAASIAIEYTEEFNHLW
ncbi:MAG TPA: FMN-binding protein [Acholeplasmataceae bacterium]|nr:FMN-binding protein [Acholeplasmataceae bacterium]